MNILRFPSRLTFTVLVIGGSFWLAPKALKPLGRVLIKNMIEPTNFSDKPHRYLIVGLDDSGKRADAIFIGYPNPQTSSLVLLVMPRDCEIGERRKLNGLWQKGRGPFKAKVEELLKQKFEGVLALNFQKLPPLLDTAFPEGLSCPVPYRLHYQDKHGGFKYDIPAGRQILDTKGLMALLRDRYSDPKKRGEAARVANWRRFLTEARQELTTPRGLLRLPAIAQQGQKVFETGLSKPQLQAALSSLIQSSDLRFSYLPSRSYYQNKKWFTTLDVNAARKQAKLAERGVTIPKGVVAYVVNGTTRKGLARRVGRRIEREFGIPMLVGNGPIEKRSRIEYSGIEAYSLCEEIMDSLGYDGQPQEMRDKSDTILKSSTPMIIVRLGANAS